MPQAGASISTCSKSPLCGTLMTRSHTFNRSTYPNDGMPAAGPALAGAGRRAADRGPRRTRGDEQRRSRTPTGQRVAGPSNRAAHKIPPGPRSYRDGRCSAGSSRGCCFRSVFRPRRRRRTRHQPASRRSASRST
jgi:hypothetical protein